MPAGGYLWDTTTRFPNPVGLMRSSLAVMLAFVAMAPAGLQAQDSAPASSPAHVVVESSTLVLDRARVRRLGLDRIEVSSEEGTLAASGGWSPATVQVSSRVGGLDVYAWLDLVRSKRAVQRESTQRIVVLSGSTARLASEQTLVGPFGQAASAGPQLWVEPVALEDGRVRLRVWTAVGDIRPGPFGTLRQEVPVEASTEIIVPSGTPVMIASMEHSAERSHSGLLARSSSAEATQAWIVVTPRVVADAAHAFEMPADIPRE